MESFSHTLLNMDVSCSTKHDERAWQSLTCHIKNVFENQKAFSLQIKARVNQRKMIQKKNSVLIRKKQMRIEGNRKKSRDHTWLRYEKEAMFCYFCRKSKKTNPFASAEGCTNFCPPKTKNVPQNFSQGDKLSPSDQILAQTLKN